MNLDALLLPLQNFFTFGIGQAIANFARLIFNVLYPANAEAATTVPPATTTPQPASYQ